MSETLLLPELGLSLKLLRKEAYPKDTQKTFSFRIRVSKGTYVKMEKGDLSVSLAAYYRAADLLGVADRFDTLFNLPEKGLLEELGL